MSATIAPASSIDFAKLPPGPKNAALQSFRYFRDPFGYYDEMQERFGDTFTMPTLNGTLVITMTPEGAREILSRRDFVVGFGFDAVEPLLGSGSLLLTAGERHTRDRKLLSPTFHGNRLRKHGPTIVESALHELESWTPGREFAMRDAMEKISLEVIIRALFGVQEPDRVERFQHAIREAVLEVNPMLLFFKGLQRRFFGIGPWARLLRKLAHLDELIADQIERSRASSHERDDTLARMLEARYEDGTALDTKAIRDQLVTLLVAGHETTATTLSWAFHEAAIHDDVRARLLQEIGALGPSPELADVLALPYLDAFCHETLRRHPILPEFFRTVATDDCRFQGYDIPKGITLAGSILKVHEDERLYPEPHAFRPERFLEHKFAPHEFLVFGGGHRRCIGAAFALQEMKLVLATMLPRVAYTSKLGEALRTVRRNGTLAPEDGVPVRIEKRLDP